MKKFFTVVVLLASLSFGATADFYSLGEEEMKKEFVQMTASQWAETINKAFETQSDKVIGTVLKATTNALNSFEVLKAFEIGIELNDNCKRIVVYKETASDRFVVSIVLWDSYNDEPVYLRVQPKTANFTGKTATISREAFK